MSRRFTSRFLLALGTTSALALAGWLAACGGNDATSSNGTNVPDATSGRGSSSGGSSSGSALSGSSSSGSGDDSSFASDD